MKNEEDRLHTHIWKALQFLLPDDAVAWSTEKTGRWGHVKACAARCGAACLVFQIWL